MFGQRAQHEERIKQGPVAAALPAIGAAFSVASALGAFGGKESPAPPQIEKPKVMPTPDDEAVKQGKRRSIAQQLSRSGRQSTILSDPGDVLGA